MVKRSNSTKRRLISLRLIVPLDKVENNLGSLGGFGFDLESIDFSRNNAEGDYYFVDLYNTDSEAEYVNDFLEKNQNDISSTFFVDHIAFIPYIPCVKVRGLTFID